MAINKYHRIAGIMLTAVFLLSSCLPDGDYKTEVNYEPRDTGDGWKIASASDQGFDQGKLRAVYDIMFDEDRFITSRSLLIARNGYLVSESYLRSKEDIAHKENIMGVTKSITSLLAGITWDQGGIRTGQMIYNHIPYYFDGDRNKRDMTIDHALTMRIGLQWDQKGHTVDMFNIDRFPSSMRVVLTKPFVYEAGTEFYYNHGAPQLIMGIMQKAFGLSETDSLVHLLFDPLGIDDFVWEQHADGLHFGGLGLHIKPRDLARIGQFILQRGWWDGEQVVSNEGLRMATTQKVSPEMTGSSAYGYYWWVDDENKAFYGKGEGGQYLYIVPDRNLVIVHTANPSVGNGYKGIEHEDFISLAGMIMDALD